MFSLMRPAAFAVLVCVTVLAAGCGHKPEAAKDPESAANAFFAALAIGNTREAYDAAAFGFQAGQTFDAFVSNAQELGLVGAQPPTWTLKDIHEKESRLDGTVVSQAGKPVDVSVTLTPEGSEWKLFSLRAGTGGEKPEDRFTLVGKGTGFNDVYHQPMPSEQQLSDLVHETMKKFNAAIQTGDFHEFYGWISQQWKEGQRMTGEAAAGVTEKMLKDHFQGFTDQKIDLSSLAGLPVFFDQPPVINQDGLLELSGHIDTPQFRVNLNLEYAYELPRWKLFGINLTLTK